MSEVDCTYGPVGSSGGIVGEYMMDYSAPKYPHRLGPLDADGIPLFDLRHLRMRGGPVYHPGVVMQHGLGAHTVYRRTGDSDARAVVLRCATWLARALVPLPGGSGGVWLYDFPLRTPRIPGPFISGMGQGQGISLLLRAHALEAHTAFVDAAARAMEAFRRSIDDGGVMSALEDGSCFIQEIAHRPPMTVLNGCLYGLMGVHEYAEIADDPQARDIVRCVVRGVDRLLPEFDVGWWSRYSLGLRWNLASQHYHRVHIRQLAALGEAIAQPAWIARAQRWRAYADRPSNRARLEVTDFVQRQLVRATTLLRLDSIKYVGLAR